MFAKPLSYATLSSVVPEWMTQGALYAIVGVLAMAMLLHGLKMKLLLDMIAEDFASPKSLVWMSYGTVVITAFIWAYTEAFGYSQAYAAMPFFVTVALVLCDPNSSSARRY